MSSAVIAVHTAAAAAAAFAAPSICPIAFWEAAYLSLAVKPSPFAACRLR